MLRPWVAAAPPTYDATVRDAAVRLVSSVRFLKLQVSNDSGNHNGGRCLNCVVGHIWSVPELLCSESNRQRNRRWPLAIKSGCRSAEDRVGARVALNPEVKDTRDKAPRKAPSLRKAGVSQPEAQSGAYRTTSSPRGPTEERKKPTVVEVMAREVSRLCCPAPGSRS
jgi:hypothetical protein